MPPIFFDLCPCPIIAVTGTKGKGTTATLIYKMLKTQYKDVFLAGNIGTPALEILPKLKKTSLAILELSSFQLIDLKKSPHIAVVLMVTSEHLDWHRDQSEYKSSKMSIVKFQKKNDFAVVNQDFENSRSFRVKTPAKVLFFSAQKEANGAYLKDNKIICLVDGPETIASINDVLLPGRHNLQNVLAATVVAKLQKVKAENIAKVIKTFKGLVHRLQLVRTIDGVKYYNDSFSTTPETSIAAIRSFPRNPKILILGGSSKNSDFQPLAREIVGDKTVKAIVLIGEEAKRMGDALAKSGPFTGPIMEGAKNMRQVVSAAQKLAKAGDIVLLSPACASFGMFKNYQDRGEQFTQEVNSLK
ncbi:UDP-N-acetylmuramoyl-L-alanine--D-glutamate ligase [Candidatus Curtissbacteria bacterium]|nr:UDP-N-acetylmuramoyl-L-alanine--D-glutamate ligase [Candidatus Curtissbacteria bacterium]